MAIAHAVGGYVDSIPAWVPEPLVSGCEIDPWGDRQEP